MMSEQLYSKLLSKVAVSPADDRDYIFEPVVNPLPKRVDLRQFVPEIEDQLSLGSCVTNSACSGIELMANREGKFRDLSRLFLYHETLGFENRLRDGEEGLIPRDCLKVASKVGIASEDTWPYDITKVLATPNEQSYKEAVDYKVKRYESVVLDRDHFMTSIINIKSALAEGLPVLVSMKLERAFFDIKGPLDKQNYVGMGKAGGDFIGNHQMVIVGYDDDLSLGSWIVQNSWGPSWGDNGYLRLGYTMVFDFNETWVIREVADIAVPKPVKPAPIPDPIPEPPKPIPVPDPEPQPEPIPVPADKKSDPQELILVVAVAILAAITKYYGVW